MCCARGCHVTGSGQVECLAMMGRGPRSLHVRGRPGERDVDDVRGSGRDPEMDPGRE